MHHHRRAVVRHTWENYELGYASRREAEAIELLMIADQRREREQLAGAHVIVECARCWAPITVPELAYRGPRRHVCVNCTAGGTAWPLFVEDEA